MKDIRYRGQIGMVDGVMIYGVPDTRNVDGDHAYVLPMNIFDNPMQLNSNDMGMAGLDTSRYGMVVKNNIREGLIITDEDAKKIQKIRA